jgi:hypothetical protein
MRVTVPQRCAEFCIWKAVRVAKRLVDLTDGRVVFGEGVSRIADSLRPLGAAGRVVAESYALVTEMRRIELEEARAADDKQLRLALLERRRQESSATLRTMQKELGRAEASTRQLRECMLNVQREAVKPGLALEDRRYFIELTQYFTTMLVQHHSDLTGGVAGVIDTVLNGAGAAVLAPAQPRQRRPARNAAGDRTRRR